MILEWLTYCLLISMLLAVAALVAERSLRAQGWPGRWVWAAAMLGSLGLPLATWLLPAPAPEATALPHLPGAFVMESLPAFSLSAAESTGPSLESMALVAWGVASGALLLWVLGASLRVWTLGRCWQRERVDGVDVLVSRSTGPAAMGLIRGRVVVPAWALGLEARKRRLLLMHEAEHVRARDPGLAFAGLLACALMPWNAPLWWQLARLRLAIEVDCDARVLKRSGDARGYGTLLLEVGQRRARFAVGLSESKSSLERRIHMITERARGRRTTRAVALAALSGVVLAVACETPGPTELSPGPEPDGSVAVIESAVTEARRIRLGASASECPPTFFMDGERMPEPDARAIESDRIASIEVIKGAAAGEHECGIIWINSKGLSPEAAERARRVREELFGRRLSEQPRKSLVPQELFSQEGDRVVARVDELRAAMNDASCPLGLVADGVILSDPSMLERISDRIERVSVSKVPLTVNNRRFCRVVMITTRTAADASRPAGAEVERDIPRIVEMQPQEQDISSAPAFTPMTVKPTLKNERDVQALLERNYPSLLRSAGISGTANVWFFIDQTGEVRKTLLNETSGYEALDAAALRVAKAMEFSPAYNRDRRVPVWIALDIRFETEAAREERASRRGQVERRLTERARQAEELADKASAGHAAADPVGVQAAPVSTPMTVRPVLRNERAVQQDLMRHYPPLLRDAGIDGTVNVWVFIDETGTVRNARLNETSGYEAFDQAALRVAETLEFEPARNQGEVVAVWIALDMKFEAQ